MALYRKKPVVIEAFQFGVEDAPNWFTNAILKDVVLKHELDGKASAEIKTLEGWHHATVGDYIIRGVKGELYPCKPDIFHMTYEPAEECAGNDLTSALLTLLDTVPAHQKLYPELYVDKIVELVNKKKEF